MYPISKASASCAWTTNEQDGNYILAIETPGLSDVQGYAAPYGQFFGARLAHILGAVVNDVPKSTNVVTMMPSNAQSPVPQLAIMNGGPYSTAAAAPAGITTPSTAHFGTLQNYITDLATNIAPSLKSSNSYAYLKNHLLPTVSRLATVCSYEMSSSSTPSQNNLIKINSENVTAYDNGVVLAIQNNTGDALRVHQVTSAGKNVIGKLNPGMNHHFLHTASLMNGATAATAGASVEPIATNMIEIQDIPGKANAYIQVLNGDQLQALTEALNTALDTISGSSENVFAYNQGNTYAQPNDAQYLVLTNFNPTTIANATVSLNEVLMYRIQEINLAEFNGQPYFVTLQIDRDIVGNGLANNVLVQNPGGPAILYPSIVSVKTCLWTNPYDLARGEGFYSSIPLLLIPDSVMNSGITGLAAHYGIWLMSYAAALTEFQFDCAFGDTTDCLQNTFKLSDTSKDIPARVVIDASGVLASGATLPILSKKQSAVLMGSDVWDIGNDFHQDIPILNLYQSGSDIVANQAGGYFVNFAVTLEVPSSQNSADLYDAPYQNMMLFSLQTSDLQAGVKAKLTQPVAGHYCLEFQDKKGNVLAVQKAVVSEVGKTPTISFSFLNNQDAAWSSKVLLPLNIASQVKVGKEVSFKVTVPAGAMNKFKIQLPEKKIKK